MTTPGRSESDERGTATAALAIEARIQEGWLAANPEWKHTELGRRFELLIARVKAVLGE